SVRHDASQRFVQRSTQIDVLANHPAEHLFHVLDRSIKVDDSRLENLLTAKSQELARQGRCPFPGLLDLFSFLQQGTVRRQLILQELAVADDHTEQIIEVMRNPAGKLPDGFHSLRLTKLFL